MLDNLRMIERKAGSWIIKAKRMRVHARESVALKSATEGRFIIELLKKTQPSSDVLSKVSAMSEISIKATNAPFLEKYRSKSTIKVA